MDWIGVIGSLTLDQLTILVTIVDTGSFSAAGRKLGRVQSAISQAIATLESLQGVSLFDRTGHRPVLTETGRALVAQARTVLESAERFEAAAARARTGVEPELVIAIDPLVPAAPLMESLRGLTVAYPNLPVTFSTEGLGGSLRRLRDGTAAIGICLLLPEVPEDVTARAMMRVRMRPVVAPHHPLASLGRPATRGDLEPHVQLVLSDPVDTKRGNYGLSSSRLWRFVDLGRRMDFLLAGFGWCRMPEHLVEAPIAAGQLQYLELAEDPTPPEGLAIYAAHARHRPPGPAGRWLLAEFWRHLVMDKLVAE